MFPRRDDATNKELILTLIDIQGYLSRYGKSHTNWHETLNEVIERLEQVEGEPQESKEVPQRIHGRWKSYIGKDLGIEGQWLRDDGKSVFVQCSECDSMAVRNLMPHMNFCPNCGAEMDGEEDE